MNVRITNVDHSTSLAKVEILWAQGFRSHPFNFHYETSNPHLRILVHGFKNKEESKVHKIISHLH